MKKYILPAIAGIVAVAAIVIFLAVPDADEQKDGPQVETAKQTVETVDSENVLSIAAADLSEDEVSFIRLADDSKVELLARLDENGMPQVALGTCQSCNGSPGAYYTQQGSEIQCNNCGLTFPMTVIGEETAGCHPIPIDPEMISVSEDGITLNVDDLRAYEDLFEAVEEH